LQVFIATENSLCYLFCDGTAKQVHDIFCEYSDVRTANQLNRVYGAFTAIEQ